VSVAASRARGCRVPIAPARRSISTRALGASAGDVARGPRPLDERIAQVDDELEAAVGQDRLRLDLVALAAQAPQALDERRELGPRRPRLILHVGNLQDPARRLPQTGAIEEAGERLACSPARRPDPSPDRGGIIGVRGGV
jgi:hypothetical protein